MPTFLAVAMAAALSTPIALAIPVTDQALALSATGRGVQTYECRAAPEQPGGYGWVFVAPEASLTDAAGQVVGRHYAGPTWQAVDGSRVTARPLAKVKDPAGQGVDWLLLQATARSGPGVFANVSYIRRLATQGGLAPGLPCVADEVARRVSVPYSATYEFYRPQR